MCIIRPGRGARAVAHEGGGLNQHRSSSCETLSSMKVFKASLPPPPPQAFPPLWPPSRSDTTPTSLAPSRTTPLAPLPCTIQAATRRCRRCWASGRSWGCARSSLGGWWEWLGGRSSAGGNCPRWCRVVVAREVFVPLGCFHPSKAYLGPISHCCASCFCIIGLTCLANCCSSCPCTGIRYEYR